MKAKKKGRLGDIVSVILMVVALCVLLGAGYTLYGFYKDYKEVDEIYAELGKYSDDDSRNLALLEDDVENGLNTGAMETKDVMWDGKTLTLPVVLNPIDFEALEEINDDLVGWLKIRALDLSYPVVQGEDNDYYLHASFEKEYLFSGCLFENFDNNDDFTDKNTIIYGHNMRSGSMFGSLKTFRDEDVYNKSKYFWIYTKNIIFLYRIISIREVPNNSEVYQYAFADDEEFQVFLDKAIENSEVDTGVTDLTTEEKIVTLSTCSSYSTSKFIVQGKLVQMYASE